MSAFKARPVQFPKRELSQCGLALQDLLIQHFYEAWLLLSPRKRARLRSAMAKVVQEHFLTEAFWLAVKADLVQDGQIQVHSHLYQYLRKVLFRGNGRALLSFLAGIKEENRWHQKGELTMLIDDLDKAIAEYKAIVGMNPALTYLCHSHFSQLNNEQRTWSAARRYDQPIGVGVELNSIVRCFLCKSGIFPE